VAPSRLAPAVTKEFRHFLRDPVLLSLVLWLYTVEVVLCAVSLTFDLAEEPVGVVDLDRTVVSRELAAALDRSPSFDVRFRPALEAEAESLLERGRARMVVVIPRDIGRRLDRGEPADLQLLLDGTNSMVAMTALGEARRQAVDFSLRRPDRAPAALVVPGGEGAGGIENRMRLWYNPGLRFVYFVVISMIALAAYMVGVIHPAASIVKEKESGTIEQLVVSPLTPGELVLAKTLPTFVVGLLALGPALLIARLFGVPFRGSPVDFTLLSAVFLVSAIGTGVLIASAVRTLQQALLVAFFVLFPVMFLSGTMTPIESMPDFLQTVSLLSPLRHYMEALLGVLLKGVGLDVLWPQLLWIAGLGLALFAGSFAFFRRRLV
jgi:ABC-2 type transport system permease protein